MYVSVCVGLLTVDGTQRLGSQAGGVGDIKTSPFFADVDFAKVDGKKIPVPFIPDVSGELDTKYVPKGKYIGYIDYTYFMP